MPVGNINHKVTASLIEHLSGNMFEIYTDDKSIEGLATQRFDMSGICASKEYAKHINANSCTSSSRFQLQAKRFVPDCDKI